VDILRSVTVEMNIVDAMLLIQFLTRSAAGREGR
jgi:hypothetical protein